MKKRKFAALTVASMIAIGILAGCSTGSSSSAAAQSSSVTAESQAAVQELEVLDNFEDVSAADAEYEPQVGYDKYTVVDYYLEAADTDLMITCSAKADDSEYSMATTKWWSAITKETFSRTRPALWGMTHL